MLSDEQMARLIDKLPEDDRDNARSAFKPGAPLGLMEAIYFRLCGPVLGGEMLRAALESRSATACDDPPKRLRCPRCGATTRLMECRERKVVSTVGELAWKRPVYRCPTCKTFSPFDDALGVEPGSRYSPRMAELVDRFGTDMPFTEIIDTLAEFCEFTPAHWYTHRQVGRSGERAAELQHERARVAQRNSRAVAIEQRAKPIGASDTLVIAVDGTGVPMRTGLCNEAKVAVLYLLRDRTTDGSGRDRLQRSREVAWIGDWETFARHVYAEALRLGLRTVGRVVVIGDCADWIDRLQSEFFPGAIRIADFWHTCEYLAEAAREAHGEGTAATRKWLHVVRGKLRRGQLSAVKRALQALPAGESRTAAMRYLRNHHKKMRYDTYLAAGLPIGSGAVEGRCKNLVGTRFKRTGSRWTPDGARPVLSLRVLWRNGDWEQLYPHSTLRHPLARRPAA
ncbi:MAG: ISKra4 family transposase [Planctomycetota bacterium]